MSSLFRLWLILGLLILSQRFCEGLPLKIDGDTSNSEFDYHVESNVTLVKGDIIFRNNPVSFYMAPKDKYRLWNKRIIPYTLDPGYNPPERQLIISAMNTIEEQSCVTFVPRRDQFDYVLIAKKKGGCFSDIGRYGGRQSVNLPTQCLERGAGIALHELLHTLGLWHEHNRSDRDDYIKVNSDNIEPSMKFNFEKHPEHLADTLAEYDYESIMHYGHKDYSVNGQNTIDVLQPQYTNVIGQRKGLSDLDIEKINLLYECDIMACDKPETSKFVSIISSGPYMVGDMVRYACEPGTVLVGSAVRTCRFDGQYSGTLPQCLNPKTFVACDFETDMCDFSHHDDNDFNWNRMSASLQLVQYSGPLVDHTREETVGYYVYVESEIQKEGQKSKLISPEFRGESDESIVCLSFSYSMWGGNGQMGTLNVYASNEEGTVLLTKIDGNQGPQWQPMKLSFQTKTPVKIIFEAILGSKLYSDIAVDNFLLKTCTIDYESDYTKI